MSIPWNGKPLTIFIAKDGNLNIRAAKEGDNLAQVFECSQLEDLFATLAGSKMPVLAQNFVMYGTEKKPDGRALAVQAATQRPYTAKDGSERMANHAYSAKQLDSFVPVSFAVITKFLNIRGRNIPQPLFLAYALPMERTPSQNALAFQRVTSHKLPAPEVTIARRTKAPA